MSDGSKNEASHGTAPVSQGLPTSFSNGSVATANGTSTHEQDELLDNRIHREPQEASEEARYQALSSTRENIRTLPQERHGEMFREFTEATQSGNLGILAHTVANWALGGHGYKTAGAVVNQRLEHLPRLEDDPALFALWQEHKPLTENPE